MRRSDRSALMNPARKEFRSQVRPPLPARPTAPSHAAGHDTLGLSMAPARGRLVAELLDGQRPHIDPAPMGSAGPGGATRGPEPFLEVDPLDLGDIRPDLQLSGLRSPLRRG